MYLHLKPADSERVRETRYPNRIPRAQWPGSLSVKTTKEQGPLPMSGLTCTFEFPLTLSQTNRSNVLKSESLSPSLFQNQVSRVQGVGGPLLNEGQSEWHFIEKSTKIMSRQPNQCPSECHLAQPGSLVTPPVIKPVTSQRYRDRAIVLDPHCSAHSTSVTLPLEFTIDFSGPATAVGRIH